MDFLQRKLNEVLKISYNIIEEIPYEGAKQGKMYF